MQKDKKNSQVDERASTIALGEGLAALSIGEEKRKSESGFLYLFVALARRASKDKDVLELQYISGLLEAEIGELKKDKKKLRVRSVLRKK